MLWAQIGCLILGVVSTSYVMYNNETNLNPLTWFILTIAIYSMYVCAGTYNQIIGWP